MAALASLVGCGSSAGTGADAGSTPADAGVGTDAGGGRDAAAIGDAGPMRDAGPMSDAGSMVDAGPMSDAGSTVDAGSMSDAGSMVDGGLVACGTDPIVGGRRLPASCEEPRCHGDSRCADILLTSWGFPGYTECGATSTFDAAASNTACAVPPFSGYRYPAACGRIRYSGTIRLYCAPDRMTVVAYFWGAARESLGGFISFMHYGHQYESGASGGSGTVSIGAAAMDLMSVAFYGLQSARVTATPTGFVPQPLRVWFQAQGFLDPSMVETTGGFAVTLMP